MTENKKSNWILIVPGAAIVCVFFLLFPLLFKTFIIQAFKMPSGSMQPTLMVGDYILTDKTDWGTDHIDRGDILVFEYPKDPRKLFIKRAVGLPGESIEIRGKQLYIDGQPLQEDYVLHTHDHIYPSGENNRDNMGPIEIPGDALFVMGDNRDESNDSRFWGFVDLGSVKGRAAVIYWSWDGVNSGVRWNRIGKALQ